VICRPETIKELERNILVMYTGITRSASPLLRQQSKDIDSDHKKRDAMLRMVKLAYALRAELHNNNTSAVGEILHENWMLKKEMTAGISNETIDGWYAAARKAGATGGKILGAGAGGFLMLYAPHESHAAIKAALPLLRPVSMGFEPLGSRIIFYH
jgi:D-glycero-alpha-D-manno-heptose-7-phosphate kinase